MSVRFCIFLGSLLLIGGLTLVGINGYTTWEQGAKWAVTEQGKLIIAVTVVAIEVIGVVIVGFCGGAALGARKWVMGSILTLMMLASALVVVNSIASFQATERISSTATNEAAAARLKDADKLQASAADKAMTMAAKSDSRTARRDFIKANKESIVDFRNVKVDVVKEVDPGARLWSHIFGFTVEQIQMGQAGFTAILQILLSMVCIHASGYFLNPLAWLGGAVSTRSDQIVEPSQSGTSGTSNQGGTSGGSERKLSIVPKEEPENVPAMRADAAVTSFQEPIEITAKERMFQPEDNVPFIGSSDLDVPVNVSNGDTRVKAAVPRRKRKAKMPFDQMRRAVRASLVHGERTRSSRDIARETGWSHTQVLRQIEREEGRQEKRQHLPIRRDPRGLGANLH